MDIHRPKGAIHGWRELAKEIAIIVIGVLIALGAEQVVAGLHERQQAVEARQAIRAEIAGDMGKMIVRAQSDDCVKARLGEVGDLLARWAQGQPLTLPLWIGRPVTLEMNTARFEAATGAGRASLLAPNEQDAYSRVYSHFKTFAEAEERERPAWARLQALEAAPRFSPALEAELRMALQEAAYDRARAASAIKQTVRDGKGLNITPGTARAALTVNGAPVCVPLHASRAQALEFFYSKGDHTSEP